MIENIKSIKLPIPRINTYFHHCRLGASFQLHPAHTRKYEFSVLTASLKVDLFLKLVIGRRTFER